MKKLCTALLVLIVFSTTLSFPHISVVRGEAEDKSYLLKSTVKYSNPSSSCVWDFTEQEEDRTISLFMNNNWQTVELVNSTFSVERKDYDEDGNAVAVLQFPNSELSPGSNLSYTVWYNITAKPRAIPNISEDNSSDLDDIPSSLVSAYTHEEGPWQTSNPTLRQLAISLKGSETKVLTIVKNFVAWIEEHVSYPKTHHENPYYPIETYTRREGDCDDQAMLLITLCRILGIPSYLQIGCIYLPKKDLDEVAFWDDHVFLVQKRIGWHGWAIVYVPPWGWLPVD
jgi:transglutaminase-like putative cysteine protease